jgi:hypothetical protein
VLKFVKINLLDTIFAGSSLGFTESLRLLSGRLGSRGVYLKKFIHKSTEVVKIRGYTESGTLVIQRLEGERE